GACSMAAFHVSRRRTMRMASGWATSLAIVVVVAAGAGCGLSAQVEQPPRDGTSKEWPTYGHDAGGRRFSPVAQITPQNVGSLEVAWVYHMRPASAAPGSRGAEAAAPSRAGRGGRGS